MKTLHFDLTKDAGSFKILNATNGGPVHKRHANDQYRDNLEPYKAARIPYSRNHDSAFCAPYGRQYAHDISGIFPNFDADENDPASYDFACTDESILVTLEAGTETFFRLGQSIEHEIKKHNIFPPKDYAKWARICEHIIRHYNEGWANGLKLNIQYWEIWNEPDLDDDDAANKRTWVGTKAEFFDFYEVVAKHLKACFPNLKIGGPALAWREEWGEEFLREMKRRGVELDFFSWHIYCTDPTPLVERAERIRAMLDSNGYEKAESILNEWNYVKGWTDEYVKTIQIIHSIKGAAFTLSCMCASQHSSIDMLMYYDTRPSIFNGAFDFYTLAPLKGYYAFKWYGMLYDTVCEIPCKDSEENIYSLCGKYNDGKTITILTYFTDFEDTAENKDITLDFGQDKKNAEYEIYLLDESHDGELSYVGSDLTLSLAPNTCLLIKEK